MRYVVIGGGVTGTTAAEQIRKLNPSAEITIVSEEQHPLYSRVLLPHYLKEKVPRERVFLKKETWYAEQNIEWMRGVLCQKLDPRNKFVGLSNGRELEYDKLLIATGGELRVVDEDKRGVTYLRTLDDADHILQLLNERDEMAKAAVYGGGFMACEFVNLFAHYEIPTVLTLRGEHFWTRILTPEAGALIDARLTEGGVRVFANAELSMLRGDKELEGFVTTHCEEACSILGVGIGIQPDYSWLHDAGIETNFGIVTNEYLETGIEDVYAAGDIAEFYDPIIGRHLNVGNWMNAMTQGRVVAKNMVGEKTAFELVSSYATNILGLEIIFVGDVSKEHAEIHMYGTAADGGITQVFERGGVVVGGVMIGRNTDRKAITEAVKNKDKITSLQLM